MIKVRLFCISRLDVAYLKKLDTHTHKGWKKRETENTDECALPQCACGSVVALHETLYL